MAPVEYLSTLPSLLTENHQKYIVTWLGSAHLTACSMIQAALFCTNCSFRMVLVWSAMYKSITIFNSWKDQDFSVWPRKFLSNTLGLRLSFLTRPTISNHGHTGSWAGASAPLIQAFKNFWAIIKIQADAVCCIHVSIILLNQSVNQYQSFAVTRCQIFQLKCTKFKNPTPLLALQASILRPLGFNTQPFGSRYLSFFRQNYLCPQK